MKHLIEKYENKIQQLKRASIEDPTGLIAQRIADFKEFVHDLKQECCDVMYRHKSLQGIEDNNGWIKIDGEADLPKEAGSYLACINGEIHSVWFETSILYKDMWRNVTHYQPIIKPKPPIY